MGKGLTSHGKFLAEDLASIALSTIAVNGVDFDSRELEVWDGADVVFQAYTTGGNASAVLPVDFNLVGTVDGVLWDTVPFATLRVTQNGATKSVESGKIDVSGYRKIRLHSIENTDPAYTATLLNLYWGKTFGGIY